MGYTRIVQFVKTTEVYEYEKSIFPSKKSPVRKRSKHGGYRSKRSVKRARQAFFNLCKNHLDGCKSLPYFITLTYHNEYETSPAFADSYTHFNGFWKGVKEVYGKGISYLAVPEYQERGYLHYHALVWGLPESVSEERTTRILQRCWKQGYTDVRASVYKSDALAGYLAKYFSKAYGDSRFFGRKAYTSSRNVYRPKEAGFNGMSDYLSTVVNKDVLIGYEQYDTKYLGKVVKSIYQNTELQQNDNH